MSSAEPGDRRSTWKTKLLQRLQNPLQLRLCATGCVLLIAYLGVYMPLSGEIDETTNKIAKANKLTALAKDIEHLRGQYKGLKGRLTNQRDSKEWVEYVLNGVRKFPLKLLGLDCDKSRPLGPYAAVVMRIELEGSFHDMDLFLRWLESNKRLFRIDSMRVGPSRSNKEIMVMQLTLLGVMG